MFTDGPATPIRLEVLVDILNKYRKGLKRSVLYELLQPTPLSGGSQGTAKDTLSAALQLELVDEKNGILKTSSSYVKKRSTKENILRAVDEKVLGGLDIEYYFALFYSYCMGLNLEIYTRKKYTNEAWALQFNTDVYGGRLPTNPFNNSKLTGMNRWLGYLGLAWYDSSGELQINPYGRLRRALPRIFDQKNRLESDEFMSRVAKICPELDGGEHFLRANCYKKYSLEDKQCTLSLSQALVDLHEDKIIRLICPVDSRGWNIGLAQPSRDDDLADDRVTAIEYIEGI